MNINNIHNTMKYAHHIKLTVFVKPEENCSLIKKKLIGLIPFNFEEQEIPLITNSAEGFENRKIIIYEIDLFKENHTTSFIKNLKEKLSNEQKELLLSQRRSRLDEELYFYIRLDKSELLQGRYSITDSGDCVHIKMSIAAFPKNREVALRVVEEILK